MWILKSDNGKLIYLNPNKTLKVGRNKGDIVLDNDASISRIHALIIAEKKFNANQITDSTKPLSQIKIIDPGSKYGNFILNCDEELKIASEYIVKNNDRIRFGLQNHIFTAIYIPLISVTTGMDADNKATLSVILEEIGGSFSNIWTPWCTHMTVDSTIITEKLSCSLATGMKIVPITYWEAALQSFRENREFPDSENFVEEVNKKFSYLTGVSVSPNPMRRKILKNLMFLHFNSYQYDLYSRMILLAGGKSVLYNNKNKDIPDVSNDNVIVVQSVDSSTTQATATFDANYEKACEKLRECRRRTIPESEIALAILYCSTANYCNAKYDIASLLQRKKPNIDFTVPVIAADTQDASGSTTTVSHKIINSVRPFNAQRVVDSSQTQESCNAMNIVKDSTKELNKSHSHRNDIRTDSEKKSSDDSSPRKDSSECVLASDSQGDSWSHANSSLNANKHLKTSHFTAVSQKQLVAVANSVADTDKDSSVCIHFLGNREVVLSQEKSNKYLGNDFSKEFINSFVDNIGRQKFDGFVPESYVDITIKTEIVTSNVEKIYPKSSEKQLVPNQQKESSNKEITAPRNKTNEYPVKRPCEGSDDILPKMSKKTCNDRTKTGASAKLCASDFIETLSIKAETFEELEEYASSSSSPKASTSKCIDNAKLSRKRKISESESSESSDLSNADKTSRKREKNDDPNQKVSAKKIKNERVVTKMTSSEKNNGDKSDWMNVSTEIKEEWVEDPENDSAKNAVTEKHGHSKSKKFKKNNFFKIPDAQHSVSVPLLRINDEDESDDQNNRQFCKSYRKIYTTTPTTRIDITGDVDLKPMIEPEKKAQKSNNSSLPSAAGPSSLTSPKASRYSKKVFRI